MRPAEDLHVAPNELPSTSAAWTPSLTANPRASGCSVGGVEPARASSASTPRKERHDRDPRVAVRAGEGLVDLLAATLPWPARRFAGRDRWSFSFVAATSTMRLPYVLPRRIIEIVEIVLRTSFCAVPALSRVDPARNSGPDDDRDLVLDERAELRVRGARRCTT